MPTGAKGARGRRQQGVNSRGALFAGVDKIFAQCADNAVASGIDLANFTAVLAGGFDHTASGGVDNRRNPAGLSVKSVFPWHLNGLPCCELPRWGWLFL